MSGLAEPPADVFEADFDPWGIGKGETLTAYKPRVTPESSPEPLEKPVSPEPSYHGEKAKARRKALPSKGDVYLLRTSFPNAPEVTSQAEHHLPSAESGDESMEDVADMDDRMARMMEEKEREDKLEEERLDREKRRAEEEMRQGEAQMADAGDSVRRFGSVNGQDEQEQEQERKAEEAQQYATDALRDIALNSPAQRPALSESMDHDHVQGINTLQDYGQRKQLSGLGILTGSEAKPAPQLYPQLYPMTPLEPRFHDQEPFPSLSPLSQFRSPACEPGDSLPAISPASPEGPASPQNTTLPSVGGLLSIADKTNEVNRQRHASLSMPAPSPMTNGGYRHSFSGTHPSPGSLNDQTSPKSALSE